VKVDVRTLAATNVDLEAAVRKGRFREDLFYRTAVIRIRLPPLRERVDDIPLLAWHFLRKHAARAGKEVRRLSPEVLEALSVAPWKGNVRELENVIERAVVLTRRASVELEDLPQELRRASPPTGSDARADELTGMPYARARVVAMRAFERRYLESLLQQHAGNISSAARAGGMDRSNFRRILRKHRIQVKEG